jgi:phosphatidylglycerol:prolipoprotein diacylglycerol transferase
MLTYPQFDPVAFSIGPFSVHWYGLMYLLGFLAAWLLGRHRAKQPGSGWTVEMVDDMLTTCILGVVLGGRLGYILFYDLAYYMENPAQVLQVWNGGMSFHGGLVGVITCFWIFARKHGLSVFDIGDFASPLVPPGLFFGRLGNFINGELWGRHTTAEVGMIFPGGGPFPRHPSQLYEAALEGIAMFTLLWVYSGRRPPRRCVSGLFLMLYGSFRFIVEFFREPDAQLGFIAFNWLTMGMLLCLPMIALGMYLFMSGKRLNQHL